MSHKFKLCYFAQNINCTIDIMLNVNLIFLSISQLQWNTTAARYEAAMRCAAGLTLMSEGGAAGLTVGCVAAHYSIDGGASLTAAELVEELSEVAACAGEIVA
jgi:hypothetical protein